MGPLEIGVGLIALLIATYTDIRTREVPDWLSYALMVFGMANAAIVSLVYKDPYIFLASAAGLILFVAVGYGLYYSGQWGGGDSKFLMGMGALFGIPFSLVAPYVDFQNLFLLGFFLNMLVAGVAYALVWSVFSAIRLRDKFVAEVKKELRKKRLYSYLVIFAMVFAILLFLFIQEPLIKLFIPALIAVSSISFYLLIFVRVVENIAMYRYVSPGRLTEGDWIAKEIRVDGKYIAGPKDLGISKEQIATVKKLAAKGKVKQVYIKEGIPFMPSFLASYVLTVLYGNLFLLLL